MKSKVKKEGIKGSFDILEGLKVTLQPSPKIDEASVANDMELFLKEIEGVTPLPERPTRLFFHCPKGLPPKPKSKIQRDRLSFFQHVYGETRIDVCHKEGFVEGCAPNVSKELMSKLRAGRFSYQAYLDLHGFKKEDAQLELNRFILRSYALGITCVLVIHGKGYNSKETGPILKEMVPYWLSTSPLRKIVLAFCSARPYDGGTGALYVLLRRWRRKRNRCW